MREGRRFSQQQEHWKILSVNTSTSALVHLQFTLEQHQGDLGGKLFTSAHYKWGFKGLLFLKGWDQVVECTGNKIENFCECK